MIKCEIELTNKLGLHARATYQLIKISTQYNCHITVCDKTTPHKKVDGKSIMALLTLAASMGTVLEITFDGDDEQEAQKAIIQLINNKFGEKN